MDALNSSADEVAAFENLPFQSFMFFCSSFNSLFLNSADLEWQGEEVDESFCILLVVYFVLAECCEFFAVQGVRGFSCCHVSSALVKLHLDSAGDFLLGHVYESADCFPQRSVPQSIINQLGDVTQKEEMCIRDRSDPVSRFSRLLPCPPP